MTESLSRAAYVLGVGAAACSVFTLIGPIQYRLVRVSGPVVVALLVLAVLSIVGARLRRPWLVTAAGMGFLVASVLQLVLLGRDNWLGGDGSTASLFLGFGVGLLVLGLTRAPTGGAADSTGWG